MEILSYVLSLLALLALVGSTIVKGKNMKLILSLVALGNGLLGVSYLFGADGINGAAANFLGAAQTLVALAFEVKNQKTPVWVIVIYVLSSVALQLYLAGGITVSVVIILLLFIPFMMSIIQKEGVMYRLWTIINLILWVLYDVITKSYAALLTHSVQLLIVLIAILVYDRKRWRMQKQ